MAIFWQMNNLFSCVLRCTAHTMLQYSKYGWINVKYKDTAEQAAKFARILYIMPMFFCTFRLTVWIWSFHVRVSLITTPRNLAVLTCSILVPSIFISGFSSNFLFLLVNNMKFVFWCLERVYLIWTSWKFCQVHCLHLLPGCLDFIFDEQVGIICKHYQIK